MNKKQILELCIDNIKNLDCLGKSEVNQFVKLADDVVEEVKTTRKLKNLQQKFALLKMHASIQQLKQKHTAA
ncbi:MAG: hypothetical protein FIA89_03535 [Geobacter sp.]|nr:hypothetical protein [Geobacter sp.]